MGLSKGDLMTVNIYILNIEASKYIKQKLTKLRRNSDIIVVEDLNIPLSIINQSLGQKINLKITDLSNTIHQMNLIRHRWNIISYKTRIHFLLKYMRNIF